MFERKNKEFKDTKKGLRVRTEKKSVLKIVLIPLLLTVILVAGIYLVMSKMTERETLLKNVVVSTGEARTNTYITSDDVEKYFKVIQVEGAAVGDTAVTSLDELKGRAFYLTVPVSKGQILYKGNTKPTDARLDKYKSGYEVTSFAVSNFDKGINGKLREGAVIDIYALDPATDELTLYVSDVYVSAAYDSSGAELTTDEGVAQSFTVYVKKYEVEDMNKAINYGDIHIYQK